MQNNEISNFNCIECNNVCRNEHEYLNHMQLHWREVWKCLQCDDKCMLFKSQIKLKEHEGLYHGPDKPFRCLKCKLVFDRASQLDYHVRSIHLGEKSQVCQLCGKGFFRKADLKTHLNVHLGTNQCICEFCGRQFNHISNLIRHLRTHEGVKPYPCSVCGKRFNQASSLARHKLIHERNNDNTDDQGQVNLQAVKRNKTAKQKSVKRHHYCKRCGDSFQLMVLLKEHEKTHKPPEAQKSYQVLQGAEILDQQQYKMSILNNCDEDKTKNVCLNADNFLERIDPVRDESIDISDILSPYCSELELHSTDLMQREDVGSEIAKKFTNLDISTRGIRNNSNCVHVERNQFLIEVCESDYLNTLGLNSLELHDNVILPDSHFNNINYCVDKSYTLPIAIVDKDLNEQWDLQSQVRNDFIDFNDQHDVTGVELKNAEAIESTVNSVLEQLKDTSINLLENLQLQPIDQNPEGYRESDELVPGFSNEEAQAQTPMVRLVQNEEGEQFFELVRDTVDFESHDNNPQNQNQNIFSGVTNETVNSVVSESICKKPSKSKPRDKLRIKDLVKPKYRCTVCNKSFSSTSNLKQHTGTHFSDQQKFQCKQCGISFAWKSTLNKHIAGNHRPDGPLKFVCEICPKVYSTLSQVNEHVKRDHLKERNFRCSECGKSFFKKFDLKSHIRTHTNERPYSCKTCGKSFHHQSHIIRHERVHSGERPYTCDICQKSFSQPGSLKAHRQRHHLTKVDILDYQIDEDDPLVLNTT